MIRKHGGPHFPERHVGDLGNFQVNYLGQIKVETFDRLVKISGPYSVVGRSFVLHDRYDNYTAQPAGDAGGRIACGPIVLGKFTEFPRL